MIYKYSSMDFSGNLTGDQVHYKMIMKIPTSGHHHDSIRTGAHYRASASNSAHSSILRMVQR